MRSKLDKKTKMYLGAGFAFIVLVVMIAAYLFQGNDDEYEDDDLMDQITEEGEQQEAELEKDPEGELPTEEPQPIEETPVNKKASTPEPAPIEIKVEKKKTPPNDDGGGNSIYLDRHSVDCGNKSIMNQFHMNREKDANGSYNKIQYNYTCHTGHEGNLTQMNSGDNDDGGGNSVYLDRHSVNCGDQFINQFRLTRPSNNTIRYDYKCNDTPVDKSTCRTDKISPQEDGGGNMIYLDRQNVNCNEGEALTNFRLTRPSNNTIAYEYTCCKPKQ